MTLQATLPMSYVHERYFGRPSCPQCGQLMMAPESLSSSEVTTFVTVGYVTDAIIKFQFADQVCCVRHMMLLGRMSKPG